MMRIPLSILIVSALSSMLTGCYLEEPAEPEVAEKISEIETQATKFTYFSLHNPSGISHKINIGVYNAPSTTFKGVDMYSPDLGWVSCSMQPDRWACYNIELGACSTYRDGNEVGIRVETSTGVTPSVNYYFHGDEDC